MVEPEKYPGTNVFVNLRHITNQSKLGEAEAVVSTYRLTEFYSNPQVIDENGVPLDFDLRHLKAIHRHLFQDIYAWAGEVRSYPMKLGIDIFTPPDQIEHWATKISREIKDDGWLLNQPREYIVRRVARYLGLIGMLHPFPEGNGRTQRALLWQLALPLWPTYRNRSTRKAWIGRLLLPSRISSDMILPTTGDN
jgi:cell filamentation protein